MNYEVVLSAVSGIDLSFPLPRLPLQQFSLFSFLGMVFTSFPLFVFTSTIEESTLLTVQPAFSGFFPLSSSCSRSRICSLSSLYELFLILCQSVCQLLLLISYLFILFSYKISTNYHLVHLKINLIIFNQCFRFCSFHLIACDMHFHASIVHLGGSEMFSHGFPKLSYS